MEVKDTRSFERETFEEFLKIMDPSMLDISDPYSPHPSSAADRREEDLEKVKSNLQTLFNKSPEKALRVAKYFYQKIPYDKQIEYAVFPV